MNDEELRAELRYAVERINTYIQQYADRAEREHTAESRSYDLGVIHGCCHALSYIRRLAEDDKEKSDPEEPDLDIATLADYD